MTTTEGLTTSRTPTAPTTRRGGLSLAQGTALSVGAVLGTGVITLPALAADLAGPASLVAWGALVVLSVPLASTFAALGARYPGSGGVSTYVRQAFGDRAAAAVGWCFLFAVPVGAPPASMMAGGYVADVVGGGRATALGVALALILGTAAMNIAGLRLSGRVQLGLATVLALLMTATMALALPHGSTESLTPFAPNGWGAVGSAAAVLVWGFAGWEAVASLAGEYRDPRRDVPRATALAVTVVGVLYLGLAATSILVLGADAGRSQAPLSDLLAIALGDPARVVTAVVAVLLTLGAMNAYFAGGSRLAAALAHEGALPGWLAPGAGVGEVPRRGVVVIGVAATLSLLVTAVLGLGLTPLMLLATGCFTLVYVLGTASALVLLPRWSTAWWTAAVAFVSVLGLLAANGLHALWALGIVSLSLLHHRWRTSARASSGRGTTRPRSTSR
ncbi:amino acid exporter (AAE family) [Humibacillus xanthopallidus]|uniref:Amino acid exporter (AAE family) n=1 Tax=Humibacillus xanthopallidus TaxID=412689 RepID=A0A543PP18_9MICO|nr:amino acid permease [Humibacillus xanthopallidus]TQN45819.1 amino acid exporter (AAE family) [Humibacillus xanthopallidus]